MENKKYNDTSNWVDDTEFIKGHIHYKYPVFGQSTELIPKDFISHLIEITRDDTNESRRYEPVEYAKLIVWNFFNEVDILESYNEKMLTLNNAKYEINKLVDCVTENDSHNLTLGKCTDKYDSHNFTKVYKRLNDAREYLITHNEFATTQPTQSLINKKVNNEKTSPRRLAFYVYFLIESKLMEPFQPLQKKKQAQDICSRYGGVDLTNFQKHFNAINTNKDKNRAKRSTHNISDLKAVCEMLKGNHDALRLAMVVLNEAEKV